MLMSPAESREEKNRSGVQMCRADDFLAPASGESWDRLRLTYSQPFTHHQSFGLAFLRVRSSVDPMSEPVIDPFAPGGSGLNRVEPIPEYLNYLLEFGELESPLDLWDKLLPFLLLPGRDEHRGHPRAQGSAETVAARASGPGSSHAAFCCPEGTCSQYRKPWGTRSQSSKECRPLSNSSSQPNRKGAARARQRQHRPQTRNDDGVQATGQCPICTGSFSVETLPLHAATCGESSSPQPASPSSSSSTSVLCMSSLESSPPPSWVQCPICSLQFLAGEIEEHASLCGEVFPA